MTDPIGLEELDDASDLVGRAGFAGVDGQAKAVLARPPEEAAVVGDPERRRLGPGDVDPHHAAIAPGDGLLRDDLVELERERAVQAEDEPRLDRVLERRLVHPARPPLR